MAQVIEGVVEALVESGTDPNNVTVLAFRKISPHQLDELQTQSTEPIHWACHDPDQEEEDGPIWPRLKKDMRSS